MKQVRQRWRILAAALRIRSLDITPHVPTVLPTVGPMVYNKDTGGWLQIVGLCTRNQVVSASRCGSGGGSWRQPSAFEEASRNGAASPLCPYGFAYRRAYGLPKGHRGIVTDYRIWYPKAGCTREQVRQRWRILAAALRIRRGVSRWRFITLAFYTSAWIKLPLTPKTRFPKHEFRPPPRPETC